MGLPTFYDKLLCVPLLNLAVPAIDRAVRALGERPILRAARARRAARPRQPRAHGRVDRVLRRDDGARRDRRHAPRRCAAVLAAGLRREPAAARASGCCGIETSYCNDNAGWACNELGRHYVEGRLVPADPDRALAYFSRACEARFQAGLREPARPGRTSWPPIRGALDLRLLLREGGPNLLDMPEPELYARACRHGWGFACEKRLGFPMTRQLARGVAARCPRGWRGWCTDRSPSGRSGRRAAGLRRSARRPVHHGRGSGSRSPGVRQRALVGRRRRGHGRSAGVSSSPAHEVTVGAVRGVCRGGRRGRSIAASARRDRPTHPVTFVIVARCARLLPLAGDDAEAVAASRRPAVKQLPGRRLARARCPSEARVGEGGARHRWATIPVGRRAAPRSRELRRHRARRRWGSSRVPNARMASPT